MQPLRSLPSTSAAVLAPTVLDDPPAGMPGLGPYREVDFRAARRLRACELLRGHLVASAAAGPVHAAVRDEVARRLEAWSCRADAALAPPAQELVLADHSVVTPDVMVRPGAVAAGRSQLPGLVVEVSSPASVRRDRDVKLRLYAECGVREYWLVDPAARTVDFLLLARQRFVVANSADGSHRSRAFPGLVFDAVDLWWDVDQLLPLGA